MTQLDTNLKEIFADVLALDPSEVTEDLSPAKCESWDSFASLTLGQSVEAAFDIELSDEELMQITSYASVKKLLSDKGIG